MMAIVRVSGSILAFVVMALPLVASDRVLVDMSSNAAFETSKAAGSKLSLVTNETSPALRAVLGTTHQWPGVSFLFERGIDASTHGQLTFQMKNSGESPLRVRCRIDSRPKGSDESAGLTRLHDVSLEPGKSKEVRIPLIPHIEYEGISPKGWRVDGRGAWLHAFVGLTATCYEVDATTVSPAAPNHGTVNKCNRCSFMLTFVLS